MENEKKSWSYGRLQNLVSHLVLYLDSYIFPSTLLPQSYFVVAERRSPPHSRSVLDTDNNTPSSAAGWQKPTRMLYTLASMHSSMAFKHLVGVHYTVSWPTTMYPKERYHSSNACWHQKFRFICQCRLSGSKRYAANLAEKVTFCDESYVS